VRKYFDVIIVGSGPAGLGAAFHIAENSNKNVLLIDKNKISTGGLRNDCKQNYTFPVGFPKQLWHSKEAARLLKFVERHLKPAFSPQKNIGRYTRRADRLNVQLLKIRQSHVGTDKAKELIHVLIARLKSMKVNIRLGTKVSSIDYKNREIALSDQSRRYGFCDLVLAPGRAGFRWLQSRMDDLGINYIDNIVDVGIRIESREENYKIVKDYYDPKFLFPDNVRTFCTNSGSAYVVKEKYESYYSVNGHSFSSERKNKGLVNFGMLKTIELTDPVVSEHNFAEILGQMAMKISGGKPMMQRIGDFRVGKRSKVATFNSDLYNFEPTLKGATPGDIGLAIPAKILRDIWKSMKMLDTIVPGILHPSSIIYYPEIKTYANRPDFINDKFEVKRHIYMIGDGAGTSRGITAAWASGIKAGKGILSR
jgi:uncharacterized FAD-dependent dehydrogenase